MPAIFLGIEIILYMCYNILYIFRDWRKYEEKKVYTMNIIIVGGGTVGSAICTQLAREDHDITVVDENAEALAILADSCDVFGVAGNGAEVEVLRKAHAEKADLLIAVSAKDETNLLCCAVARKLGTKHTVARVRNPEYSELTQLLQSDMNLSFTINPELAVANEIYRLLRFPSAAKINTFCRGKVELAEIVIDESSPFCGVTLNDLRRKLNIKFLVCGVLRAGVAHIPSGHFSIEAGDTVCVTAPEKEITNLFKAMGVYKTPIKNVLIAGGGRTTYYLLSLLKNAKIDASVIDKDEDVCHDLAAKYSCTVICDDSSRQEALLEAGIKKADAFLALSGIDEENAIISMYAKAIDLDKVITMISRMSYMDFFKKAGLESIVSPRSATVSDIVRYVRSMTSGGASSGIESLHKILGDGVEALEFSIKNTIEGVTDIPLKQLKPRAGVLIACIVRGNEVIIPSGDDVISKSDTVIVVTTGNRTESIKDIIA